MGKKILAGIASLAIAAAAGGYYVARKTDLLDGELPVTVKDYAAQTELYVPVFNHIKVPSSRCSRFAVLAAEKMFNEQYKMADAWNMRYENHVALRAGDLEKLAEEKVLIPGMLVTFENQESEYANGLDQKGEKRKGNHIALYVGVDPKTKSPLFAEQRVDVIQVVDEAQFRKDGYIPVEVIESEKMAKKNAAREAELLKIRNAVERKIREDKPFEFWPNFSK